MVIAVMVGDGGGVGGCAHGNDSGKLVNNFTVLSKSYLKMTN